MDLTGEWKYFEDFGIGTDKGKAVLVHHGEDVSGYLEYTETIEGEDEFKIRQYVKGSFRENKLQLSGMNYEILQSESNIDYELDNWEALFTVEGKFVGNSFDRQDINGVFVFERN